VRGQLYLYVLEVVELEKLKPMFPNERFLVTPRFAERLERVRRRTDVGCVCVCSRG